MIHRQSEKYPAFFLSWFVYIPIVSETMGIPLPLVPGFSRVVSDSIHRFAASEHARWFAQFESVY